MYNEGQVVHDLKKNIPVIHIGMVSERKTGRFFVLFTNENCELLENLETMHYVVIKKELIPPELQRFVFENPKIYGKFPPFAPGFYAETKKKWKKTSPEFLQKIKSLIDSGAIKPDWR